MLYLHIEMCNQMCMNINNIFNYVGMFNNMSMLDMCWDSLISAEYISRS